VRRLCPALLHGFALDAMPAHQAKHRIGRIAQHGHQGFTFFGSEGLHQHVRVGTRQRRDHQAVVAAGCAKANLAGFQHHHLGAAAGSVQRSRQARDAGTHDQQIRGVLASWQGGGGRRRRSSGGPQGRWQSDGVQVGVTHCKAHGISRLGFLSKASRRGHNEDILAPASIPSRP
jgi:hypothetical protein